MESVGARWGDGVAGGWNFGSAASSAASFDFRRVSFGLSEGTSALVAGTASSHPTTLTSSVTSPSGMSSVTSPVIATTPRSSGGGGTSSDAPPAWSGARSFAAVVAPRQPVKSIATSPTHLTQSEIHRQQRTFIVRRAPHDVNPHHVIQTVAEQMKVPATHLFESVLRDPQDRRRLFLTFKSLKVKQKVVESGFKLGNVHIKPSDGALSGYIPFPPFYIDVNTLITALSRHGQVIEHQFVCTKEGIRVAGFKFKLKLHQNAVAPREFRYGDTLMAIRYDDDLRSCSFCGNFGHTVRYCRKREAADAERKRVGRTEPGSSADVPDGSDQLGTCADASRAASLNPTTASTRTLNPDAAPTAVAGAVKSASAPTETVTAKTVERLWLQNFEGICREEDQVISELLFHQYCRLTALHDIVEELASEFRDNGMTEEAIAHARTVGGEVAVELNVEWQKEWLTNRSHYHELRQSDYANYVVRGLPTSYHAHPAGLEEIPFVPDAPDFTSLRDVPADRVSAYVVKFGLVPALRRLVLVGVRESLPIDMDRDASSDGDDAEDDTTSIASVETVTNSSEPMETDTGIAASIDLAEVTSAPPADAVCSAGPTAPATDADAIVTSAESTVPPSSQAVTDGTTDSAPAVPKASSSHADVKATPELPLQDPRLRLIARRKKVPAAADSASLQPNPAESTHLSSLPGGHDTSSGTDTDTTLDPDEEYPSDPNAYQYYVEFNCHADRELLAANINDAFHELANLEEHAWIEPNRYVLTSRNLPDGDHLYRLYLPGSAACRFLHQHVYPLITETWGIRIRGITNAVRNRRYGKTAAHTCASPLSPPPTSGNR